VDSITAAKKIHRLCLSSVCLSLWSHRKWASVIKKKKKWARLWQKDRLFKNRILLRSFAHAKKLTSVDIPRIIQWQKKIDITYTRFNIASKRKCCAIICSLPQNFPHYPIRISNPRHERRLQKNYKIKNLDSIFFVYLKNFRYQFFIRFYSRIRRGFLLFACEVISFFLEWFSVTLTSNGKKRKLLL